MKIGTLSIVVGTNACNAKCPFCVSVLSGKKTELPSQPNWRNFGIACKLASDNNVSTVLLTGKGEPTLYPELVEQYIERLKATYGFPLVEMQTNGILLSEPSSRIRKFNSTAHFLSMCYVKGMTTISISVVHPDSKENAAIMSPTHFYDYWSAVNAIHEAGMSVRINCTMVKGGVDSTDGMLELIRKCRTYEVEQLTFREVTRPESAVLNEDVDNWVKANNTNGLLQKATKFMDICGATKVLTLPHGAVVYDFNGQNVCLSNCLTESRESDEIRQLIYFPDGKIRYSWVYSGAVIL